MKEREGGWVGIGLTPKQYPPSSGDDPSECGSDTDNHSCPGPASVLPIHLPEHADEPKKEKEQNHLNNN